MKNASIATAATIIALLLGFQSTLSAQKTATWKGGTPGKPTEWNCPTNWKEGRVPDEFSNVVIPDVSSSTFVYPIIERGEVEVMSLVCAPGTRVVVRRAARLLTADAAEGQDESVAGLEK